MYKLLVHLPVPRLITTANDYSINAVLFRTAFHAVSGFGCEKIEESREKAKRIDQGDSGRDRSVEDEILRASFLKKKAPQTTTVLPKYTCRNEKI